MDLLIAKRCANQREAMLMHHAKTRGCDRIAHGYAATIAAMKLKACHEPRVCQALQATLSSAGRTAHIEAAMNLAAQHVSHRSDKCEDLYVQRLWVKCGAREQWFCPTHAVRAGQIDQLAVAL